jgi:predicted small integral membrane protein
MDDQKHKRQVDGFLPFHTNAFDRVFIGVMILIGIHLLWLRFMEPALPIEAATALSLVIGYVVVRRG